jgi:hypothetical protein
MEYKLSAKEEIYIERLKIVTGKIEKVLNKGLIDFKYAKKLTHEYSSLSRQILNDSSLSERDKDNWSLALSEAYEPYYNKLIFKMASLVQQRPKEY